MAEMNDRGQLLLVAGVLLAVVFVALALLVNTAIYTDNVATRGDAAAAEALEYQAGVTDAVGGLLEAENRNPEHDNRTDVRDAVASGTAEIDAVQRQNHLRRAATTNVTADVTAAGTTNGTLIRQNESARITDWNVSDADGVRAFDLAIDADSVGSDRLNVTLGPSTLFIANRTGTDDLTVALNATDNVICETEASGTVRFAVTEGRLGGEPCRFPWPALEDDDAGFETNGDIDGTYNLTVATTEEIEGPDPEASAAVYSIDALEIRIVTPTVRYETTVRIAPEEPHV